MATYDVVIVGAGMAGLAAADLMVQANELRKKEKRRPLTFVVLEGSSRAGGRTSTEFPKYGHLDMGGQYLSPPGMQTYLWAMVQRFGLETFPTWLPRDQTSVYEAGSGILQKFTDNYPVSSAVEDAVARIEMLTLTAKAHLGAPWKALDALALDSMSVEEWGKQFIQDPATNELLTIAVRSAFSVEPKNISFLHFLHYGATCGSFQAYENVCGGGDAVRFRYGTKSLVDALVKAIGPKNVKLRQKVIGIAYNDSGATVTTTDAGGAKQTWTAAHTIVAMSPSAANVIPWTPELPKARRDLCKGMPMARTIKGFAIFKQPFWRNKGFTGYALSAKGPADWVMDNTWQKSDGTFEHPSLMTFIVASKAVKWGKKTRAERKAAVLEQLGRLFQDPEAVAANFVDYVDCDWGADPWAKGCPAGCFKPGVLTKVGSALAAPVGRIHWAGSETATDWMGGYMNGALQSGVRAAGEVIDAITYAQLGVTAPTGGAH